MYRTKLQQDENHCVQPDIMSTSTIPSTMKAQVLEEFNKPYVFREGIPTPQIVEPLDVLVQVEAASFCHTDELMRTGSRAVLPKLPFIGCHEFAGVIVAVGPGVQTFKIGDRVGVPTKGFHSCGSCEECQWTGPFDDEPGYSVYCPSSLEMGLTTAGGFAQYAVADSRALTPVPDSMTSLDTAPLMCAGITIFAALQKLQLGPSQHSVGILGAGGGLGHLGVQFAEKMGLDVVAVDAADGPLELLKKVVSPKTMIVDARKTSAAKAKQHFSAGRKEVSGEGLDAVILLPDSQSSFDYGMDLLKRHGTMMIVSLPQKGFHLNPADVCRRDIKVLGVQIGSGKLLRQMMEFVGKHGIRSVSHVYPFRELNQLLEDSHHSQGGKYVLDVSKV